MVLMALIQDAACTSRVRGMQISVYMDAKAKRFHILECSNRLRSLIR